jgi:hypothetical protein
MLSFQQNIIQEGRTSSARQWGGGLGWEFAQTMYIHVSKCKNGKKKKKDHFKKKKWTKNLDISYRHKLTTPI